MLSPPPNRNSAMRIDVIDDYEAFARLGANWEAVYDRDPEAQFFLSWTWFSRWLENDRSDWFVLAAKPDAEDTDYVAFFPLRFKTRKKKQGGFVHEIALAGKGLADYTGLLCAPEHETEAISAFARHLRQRNWAALDFQCLRASEKRLQLLLGCFSARNFTWRELDDINKRDNINNNICPHVSLPGDWDAYLAGLSSNTRQKIRRFLRKVDDSGEFRVTLPEADTVERDLAILLDFWSAKWGARKGDRLPRILKSNSRMILHCYEQGTLFLPVLWQAERPLAALASFIDANKKALLFMIGGRDETFNGPPPPGFVLHAWSIRHAINEGYATYDFLRGNEDYKYQFGAREAYIKHIKITTRNGHNLGKQLDRMCVPAVMKRTLALHKAGRFAEAEIGYRQVLKVAPRSVTALYGLGQLMAQKGNHKAAVRAFRRLLAVKPESEKAWLRLGRSLEARESFAEAADAYRKALDHDPGNSAAPAHLRNVLTKLGRSGDAEAAFETAAGATGEREYQPSAIK